MSKRKFQFVIFGVLVVAFVGALIGTFSRPAPAHVSMTFAGYTIAPSPYAGNVGFQFTNALFFVSNAGTAKVRLTLRDYLFKSGNHTMFMHSDLGILCSLKPGQSTNLIVPIVPNDIGLGGVGPDYRWRVELSSKRNWLANLERQPKWLQNVVMKAVPQSWLADLHRKDVVSDWITNHEATPDFPLLINGSRLNNTNQVPRSLGSPP
jgi:hypothetical protein